MRRLEDMEGQANYLAEWEALGDWRMGDGISSACCTTTRDDLVARRESSISIRTTPGVDRLSSDVERVDRRRSRDAMRALLDATPRPAPLAPPPPYHAHALAAAQRADVRARGGRRARVSHGERRADPRATQAGRAARARGRVHGRRRRREEAAELAGLTTLMVRTALKGTATRSALQIAEEGEMLGGSVGGGGGLGELRLVDLRAGALRRRRRSSCSPTSCSIRRSTTTRSRPSARSRSPTSSRCATTCIAIRCAWRRRRRSPAIRTECPASGTEETLRAHRRATRCASGIAERALDVGVR